MAVKPDAEREARFARALSLARRRLVRLRIATETFGMVAPERWLAPFPAGFALRHVWWAGEEAGLWRFGMPFPRWPDTAETRRLLEQAWRDTFLSSFEVIDFRIADWSARAMQDPLNVEFVEGLKRADRILAAVLRGAGGDSAIERARGDYAALKRRQKRSALLFSPDRLYAYLVYHDLWAPCFGSELPEDRLAAALWPPRRFALARPKAA